MTTPTERDLEQAMAIVAKSVKWVEDGELHPVWEVYQMTLSEDIVTALAQRENEVRKSLPESVRITIEGYANLGSSEGVRVLAELNDWQQGDASNG